MLKRWMAAVLALGFAFCCGCSAKEESILGLWQSAEGMTLEITETHFCMEDVSLPYELGEEGAFVLDSGILGALDGVCSVEDGQLLLNIEGMEFSFTRAD